MNLMKKTQTNLTMEREKKNLGKLWEVGEVIRGYRISRKMGLAKTENLTLSFL